MTNLDPSKVYVMGFEGSANKIGVGIIRGPYSEILLISRFLI